MAEHNLGQNESESGMEYNVSVDKHLPTFSYDEAPQFEAVTDLSPRMKDETWSTFEAQSESKNGAT